MPRPKKSFSPEFKDEAVQMVIETSRPIAKVAKELGINEGTLGNWVGIYRREHAGEEPPLTVSERARVRELERETRGTEDGKRVPEKSRSVLCQGSSVSDKFEFIDVEYAAYRESDEQYVPSIVKMCIWMEVSRSGFYGWRDKPESATAKRRGILALYVKKSFDDSDDTYGYRRVHADLVAWGVPAAGAAGALADARPGPGAVPAAAVAGQPDRGRRSGARHPRSRGRDFTADAPGEKMVGDITYISTWEGWLYLATVIDCHTKAVIGWAVDDNYKTPLIEKAVEMAARNYPLAGNAIFHSDRGSNYTSCQFAGTLKKYGLRQSVGRTGICDHNAMAESFFAALKNECVYRTQYQKAQSYRRLRADA